MSDILGEQKSNALTLPITPPNAFHIFINPFIAPTPQHKHVLKLALSSCGTSSRSQVFCVFLAYLNLEI